MSIHDGRAPARCRSAVRALVTVAGCLLAGRAAAQAPLVDRGSVGVGPVFTSWTVGGGGLPEPTFNGSSTVQVTGVSQWSIPVRAAVNIGSMWAIDVSAAYAAARVSLAGRDSALNTTHYDLSGITDVRFRATGHIVGDDVVVTLAANAPTGATSLKPDQLSALRVVSAPALALATPILGLGPSGTAGLVLAHQIGGWAWGVGGTYELRRAYTPVADVAGLGAPNFSPSNVIHVSAGTEGLIGQSAMSLTASVDLFGTSRITTPPSSFGGTPVPGLAVGTRVGPILSAAWQLRLPPSWAHDITLFAIERYRSAYTRDGFTVPGSSGHYVDAGVSGAIPLALHTAVEAAFLFRYQTGLPSDNGFATAGTRAGGVRLGLAHRLGQTLFVTPFVRGELGELTTAGVTRPAHALGGGIVLAERF